MDKDQLKRMMLFGGVSFVIIIAWQFIFPPPRTTPQPVSPAVPASSSAASSSAAITTSATGSSPAPGSAPATSESAPAAPALAAVSAESFTLVVGKSTVVIRNRGAAVESWTIDGSVENSKNPVELVHPYDRMEGHALPLSFAGEPAADVKTLNEALWQCAAAGNRLDCEYAGGGLHAKKTLVLHENYLHDLTIAVERDGKPLALATRWGPGLGHELSAKERAVRLSGVRAESYLANDSIARPLAFRSSDGEKSVSGPLRWYGLTDNFYGALFVPTAQSFEFKATATPFKPPVDADGKTPAEEMLPSVSAPFTGGQLFVGPKRYNDLHALDHDLDRASGFYSRIPFVTSATLGAYRALIWLAKRVSSWGLAIILLTLLFRLVLLPVTFKGMVGMRVTQVKMQRIQSKVDDIRTRHKKKGGMDSQMAMNSELGELYKKHGISQFSMLTGCLPMLLQWPLFLGYYYLLSQMIELKGQHFLHLKDLTAADPWLIFPILSGLFMFISSYISSRTIADKFQRTYSMLLPLIFAWFFIYYPAGLSVYWTVSNIFTIGQQKLINHYGDKKAVEERAREKLKSELEKKSK